MIGYTAVKGSSQYNNQTWRLFRTSQPSNESSPPPPAPGPWWHRGPTPTDIFTNIIKKKTAAESVGGKCDASEGEDEWGVETASLPRMTALCNTCTTSCSGFLSSNTPRQHPSISAMKQGKLEEATETNAHFLELRRLHTVGDIRQDLRIYKVGHIYLKALCSNRQKQENGPSADLYRSRRWPQSPVSSATPATPPSKS